VRRSAVIQDEICCRAFCKWLMLEWKSDGWKERNYLLRKHVIYVNFTFYVIYLLPITF